MCSIIKFEWIVTLLLVIASKHSGGAYRLVSGDKEDAAETTERKFRGFVVCFLSKENSVIRDAAELRCLFKNCNFFSYWQHSTRRGSNQKLYHYKGK